MKIWHKATLAALCSFCLVNFLCMFYYSAPGDLYRNNGATKSIRVPQSYYVNTAEGFGIIHFDKNGYNNMDGKLKEPYVLIMGSSHMEATYVQQHQNTSAILNNLLGGTETELRVYNIAHANNPLPDIIKGFSAGIEEFPDSCAIVIEIYDTSFPIPDLKESLQQTAYKVDSSGIYLSKHLNANQKLKSSAIGWLPFLKYVLNRQLASIKFEFKTPFGLMNKTSEPQASTEETNYMAALNRAFSLICDEYAKPIIILYHPKVNFYNNAMTIVRDKDTYDIFKNTCENNGIIFVDTGKAFIKAFKENYTVPYGFYNTAMGDGHLNADGHKIVAHELYQVLKDLPGVTWK